MIYVIMWHTKEKDGQGFFIQKMKQRETRAEVMILVTEILSEGISIGDITVVNGVVKHLDIVLED